MNEEIMTYIVAKLLVLAFEKHGSDITKPSSCKNKKWRDACMFYNDSWYLYYNESEESSNKSTHVVKLTTKELFAIQPS